MSEAIQRAPAPPARVPTGRPEPVLCVTGHERRDLGVAEAVCAGRFTFAGITRELGTDPNWLGADLPADEEWRIEWSKFYYGLDLAHAYSLGGEPRHLEAWERLVGSWIAQVPVGWDAADVEARRIQNWVYAWQRFAAAPAFPGLAPDFEERLLESIAAQAAHLRAHLAPKRNHRTLALYALLVVALALAELDPDGELRGFALAELDRNLAADFRPDGVHCESSTHYHLIALRSLVGAAANARRFGLELPAGFAERLGRACDFALHCTRPDGAIPALSDADTGRYARLLALAGQVLDRDDLRYAASAGARGVAPAARMASFPHGGYHVQRSGWGDGATRFADERFLIFDCGPLGDGGHGHYDLLSVEIAAGGRPLVMDPGRFTYAEGEPNLRRWFRATAAHNTVCVDGRDQTPYTRGRPSGPVAEGRFRGRWTAPRLDVLAGAAHSPAYEAVHERRIAFVGDAYWIVEDRVRGERPHRYDLRWHLAPDAWEATAVEAGADDGVVVRAPGVALVIAGAVAVAVEPGWVAPRYGHRQPAPVVSAVAEGVDAHFVTLVVPREDAAPAPALRVEAVEGPAEATVVEVADPSGRDVVALRRTAGDLAAGPLRADGRAAWAREGADGALVASAVCPGGGA